MPQFQSSVVRAVQNSPLADSATHAVALTWANGGGCAFQCVSGLSIQGPRTTTASIEAPVRMEYAVTTGGLCVRINFLLSRIHASDITSEATTSRSPASDGSPRAAGP